MISSGNRPQGQYPASPGQAESLSGAVVLQENPEVLWQRNRPRLIAPAGAKDSRRGWSEGNPRKETHPDAPQRGAGGGMDVIDRFPTTSFRFSRFFPPPHPGRERLEDRSGFRFAPTRLAYKPAKQLTRAPLGRFFQPQKIVFLYSLLFPNRAPPDKDFWILLICTTTSQYRGCLRRFWGRVCVILKTAVERPRPGFTPGGRDARPPRKRPFL